jgi:hypothetical protein
MAARRQIVYDSRLPVGENSNINDATHPRNIVMLAASTESQAAADQRYDINPPPRVEGFLSYIPTQSLMRLPFLVNVFIVCLLLVAVFQIKQNLIKTVLAVGIIFFLHSVINQFNTRCSAPTSV